VPEKQRDRVTAYHNSLSVRGPSTRCVSTSLCTAKRQQAISKCTIWFKKEEEIFYKFPSCNRNDHVVAPESLLVQFASSLFCGVFASLLSVASATWLAAAVIRSSGAGVIAVVAACFLFRHTTRQQTIYQCSSCLLLSPVAAQALLLVQQ